MNLFISDDLLIKLMCQFSPEALWFWPLRIHNRHKLLHVVEAVTAV